MKDKIREILYSIRPDGDFDHSNSFWEDGYIDSLDIMELIDSLEEEYQVEIELEYIKGSNFTSYESIEKMIYEAQK